MFHSIAADKSARAAKTSLAVDCEYARVTLTHLYKLVNDRLKTNDQKVVKLQKVPNLLFGFQNNKKSQKVT